MAAGKLKKYLKIIILASFVLISLIFLTITYLFSAFKVEGNSMEPILQENQRILIYKVHKANASFQRFDIIVLNKPDEPGKEVVKRIIGLPGETIQIKAGEVYINFQKIDQPFLAGHHDVISRAITLDTQKIPEGCYFVLGDNRPFSWDSRNFGPVPVENINGRVIFRYWPFSAFGPIKQ